MIRDQISLYIQKALTDLDYTVEKITVTKNRIYKFGEYATPISLELGKKLDKNTMEVAMEIAAKIESMSHPILKKVEAVKPGFINFFLTDHALVVASQNNSIKKGRHIERYKGRKVLVEYTDPNPFKLLHIGHLMNNVTGEAIASMIENAGARVIRICYQGDIGLHVAKVLWSLKGRGVNPETLDIQQIGEAYTKGSTAYDGDKESKKEIKEINSALYSGTEDDDLKGLYKHGRRISLEHFEDLYRVLGTKFDGYFFESEVGSVGLREVRIHIEDNIFEKSDGAVVYRGENKNLNTRVFITSEGNPTYEAKEIGLAITKDARYGGSDYSFIVTASEQDNFFDVVYAAIKDFAPKIAEKTTHISHGMMRLVGGKKMSSRTGSVVSGEEFLNNVKSKVLQKMSESKSSVSEKVAEVIAVSAIKCNILRQESGKDIVFDIEKETSFTGDSGPYLLYTLVRARKLLILGRHNFVKRFFSKKRMHIEANILRELISFDEVVEDATIMNAPHHLVQYLIRLASAFNEWYSNEKILGTDNAAGKLILVEQTCKTLDKGLQILGIESVSEM